MGVGMYCVVPNYGLRGIDAGGPEYSEGRGDIYKEKGR